MEFRILGPLEVCRDGQLIDVKGSKRRALLALLVLRANEVVHAERLIDELWGDDRPANAAAALHNHVSRLRKDIGADVLVTTGWGYVLRVSAESVDAYQFDELVTLARPLAARDRRVALADALNLWRGPALADLSAEPGLAAPIGRLEEQRLAALEQRVDAELELGWHEQLVPELEALVGQYPLNEKLRGQLILALYRAGRQAEALETYRETRRLLVEDLGIEPSPDLRELERAILRQDPSLAGMAPSPDVLDNRSEHWRWPRSPLIGVGLLVILVAAGALTALITTQRDGSGIAEKGVVPPPSSAALGLPAAKVANPPSEKAASTRSATTSQAQPGQATTPTPSRAPRRRGRTVLPIRAHPTSTKTKKGKVKSAVPTPKRPYWLVDRFDGDAIDLESWHVATNGLVDDAGVEFVERDGRLQVTVSQDVAFAGNGFDKHLGTQCMLLGDFDARVEYGLLDWPADDGMYLTFGAFFHWTNGWSFVARAGRGLNGGFDSYTAQIAQTPRVLQTNDSSGALRLKRRRGVMTAYVRHSGQWFELNSARRPGSVNLIIGFSSNRDQFGHSAATVSLDNFEATADSVDCAGFPVPPRKPRS